jgi:hypothetical protein
VAAQPEGADFEFGGIEPGNWLLIADGAAGGIEVYGEMAVFVEEGRDVARLELPAFPLTEIRGRLIPVAGQALPEQLLVTATLRRPEANEFPANAVHADWRKIPSTLVAAGGQFTLDNLMLGQEYTLLVHDRLSSVPLGAAHLVGGQPEALSIRLGGVGSLRGRVLNNRGEACTGMEVHLTTGLGTVQGEPADIQTRRLTTGFDGSFVFESVPSGPARILLPGDPDSARLVSIPVGRPAIVDLACRIWVPVVINLRPGSTTPYQAREQFLIVPQPGTVVSTKVRELRLESLRTELEPGNYTITRTATMESKPFQVLPRLGGPIDIEFTE